MKKMMFLLAMCGSTLAMSQPANKYAAFNTQKKSMILNTGITMKYIDTGNAMGAPLILLHGSTDTGRSFQLTIEELIRLNSNLRIIAPDLRGHGETSLPDKASCAGAPEQCFTPADFASDLIALMNQLHIAKAHIVGHSMGSVIAQEIALKYADRVSSIVLIGTFVNGKECRAIHDFLLAEIVEGKFKSVLEKRTNFQWPKDAYTITPKDLGLQICGFLKENWVTEIATDEAYLGAIYGETIQVPIGSWIGMFSALGKVDNRVAMAELKVPTLILNASQDMLVPESDQAQVKASLEKAAKRYGTKIIYKTYGKTPLPDSGFQENDLGHNLQWAAPKQVAADIWAFINNGYPLLNISYVNPTNKKQVITENTGVNIIDFYKK